MIKKLFLVTIVGFLLASPAFGATYYVCKDGTTCNQTGSGWSTGNDSNGGQSRDDCWLTIGKATNTVLDGSTVIIGNSDYDERPTESTSGGSGTEIVYQAESGAVVVLNGMLITGAYVHLKDLKFDWDGHVGGTKQVDIQADYPYVYNCTFVGSQGNLSLSDADYGIVESCEFSEFDIAISIHGGTNLLIVNNSIHSPGENWDTVNCDGIIVTANVAGFPTNLTIRGNLWYDWNQGKTGLAHADGIQFYPSGCGLGDCADVIMERNWFDMRPGCAQSDACITAVMFPTAGASSYGTGYVFRYNIVRGNNGFKVPENCYYTNGAIYGNTFISDLDYTVDKSAVQLAAASSNWYVHNNITVDYNYRHFNVQGSGMDTGHNYSWNSDESDPANVGVTPTEADPKFINYTDSQSTPGNYSLASDSPCIDAGATVSEVGDANEDDGLHPSSQYANWPGPSTLDQDEYGSGWEIGAYVYEENSDDPIRRKKHRQRRRRRTENEVFEAEHCSYSSDGPVS